METNMAAAYCAKQSKFVLLSLLIVAAFGGIGSYATAGADPLPYGPDTCIQGYVWREAGPGDVVCVTPATRSQASSDNAAAASNAVRRNRDCLIAFAGHKVDTEVSGRWRGSYQVPVVSQDAANVDLELNTRHRVDVGLTYA
jgi:hypothetical protein